MNLNDYKSQRWKIVSYAADCIQSDEWVGTDEPGDLCSLCLLDYVNECQCPGPTQDDMEYEYLGNILIAREITNKNHT
jgi:hypothetical protein